MHSRFGARVFVFIFTSRGFEHAHSGTNSPHIDVAHVTHAKIDDISANCSCILLKLNVT